MKTETIKSNSAFFLEILKLWRANSSTLGLFPEGAFLDAASKNRIIGAIDEGNSLRGYLLYRISRNKAFIVHLCIQKEARGTGVARILIDELKKRTSSCFGIALKCRQDYEANKAWPKFNFHAINESPGRSKEGTLLVSWWFSHNHVDLFSQQRETLFQSKTLASLDANVFFDLKEQRDDESMSLLSDWLIEEIEFCITKELYNEIQKSPDENQRNDSRKFAKTFTLLESTESQFQEVFSLLKKSFNPKTQRDESDLKQLAQAISGGAEFFITRDEVILDNSDLIEQEFNIEVKRPSDLILQFDELIRSSNYQPQSLSGTVLESRLPNEDQVNKIVEYFINSSLGERATELKSSLRSMFSKPQHFTTKLIYDKHKNMICVIVYETSNENELLIPFFRVTSNSLKKTLVKHLASAATLQASNENKQILGFTDKYIANDIKDILLESGFINSSKGLFKIIVKGLYSKNNFQPMISELLKERDYFKLEFSAHVPRILNKASDGSIHTMERFLWPLKLIENEMPTFIIPIKPKYASELFDENLLSAKLWATERELVLNRQNVYYRSGKPRILESPGRILWYVSTDDSTDSSSGRMQLRACSYLDEVFVDKAKLLYSKFKKLGIYEWPHIFKLAKENADNSIMAFTFSDTELFKNPITFTSLKRKYVKIEKKNLAIQSPVKISHSLFLELYKLGTGL